MTAGVLLLLGCAGYYAGPPSDHFDGKKFHVPNAPYPNGFRSFLKWQMNAHRTPWPDQVPNGPFDHPPERVEGHTIRATLVGHATVLIQTQGLNILTDPIWSERASPFSFIGPKRVDHPGIAFDDLPPIDLVLISHNHYDHLDLPTLKLLEQKFHPLFAMPLGNDKLVQEVGKDVRTVALDWGQSQDVANGVKLHLEPSWHWSARGIFDRNEALWGAFVIETPGGNLYATGDAGIGDGETFRQAGETYGPFRLALIPIGAYEPHWFMGFGHMNPNEAAEAFTLLKAEKAIGYHWGTFHLTDEGREEPRDDLAKALPKHEIPPENFRAFVPGEVWELP